MNLFITLIAALSFAQEPEKQAALGAQMAREVRRNAAPIDSPVALDFVRRLGERLKTQLPSAQSTYRFELVKDALGESANGPFALPGGYIFVPSALILGAKSEDEVAGMMAHSMAHRFPTASGDLANYGTIPLIFLGGSNCSRCLPKAFEKQVEALELDADRDAVSAISAAGYNPSALFQYLSRFPIASDRLDLLQQSANSNAPPPSAAFLAIQDEIRRLH
jgi:predicted Zn-dependent protease